MFDYIDLFDDMIWAYVGFPIIILLGLWLSFISGFAQIRRFPEAAKIFIGYFKPAKEKRVGVHPLNAFFACLGGCIGIGNIVAICTAVQIGGPGALFWVWVTAILGMVMKYSEVYLGMRYRIKNEEGSYDGGPMYFLQRVFKGMWAPMAVALLLCVYGVEIYQFRIVTESLSANFGLNVFAVAFVLLMFVIYAGSGGVKRVGKICSAVIPIFILIFISMGLWILLNNFGKLPEAIATVFTSAFTGHAAVGGFVGSTLMITITQGIRRGCYASDVGIGYAAVIYSESSSQVPERQSSLIFIDLFLDIFVVCTTSVLLILVTDVWTMPIHESLLVQMALSQYFPYMNYFMPLFILSLGYSTIIAYFCVGMKCAEFLSPQHGRKLFYVFATLFFISFTFLESRQALTIMSIIQMMLLILNGWGIFKLRRDVSFYLSEE
ncbi:MAG: Amino-acid carrier protein AlsT [Chlamydiae bacterium]|nr:Amino-acid carrier protein AlsT [Chlamydiota bacterium]